jgi:integrating conjugative element protein (TIGR03749 family)
VSSPKSEDSLSNLEPVHILLEEENVAGGQTIETIEDDKSNIAEEPNITPVELVRYASQRLYGPTRLHKDVRGIVDTPLGIKENIRVFKGQAKYRTVSTPIVAYRGGAYYLAGIYIKNVSADKLQLDYLDLNLPFHTATFQHHTLESHGVPGDATTLYLVSEEPLKNMLQPWTYYHDIREAEKARLAELEK